MGCPRREAIGLMEKRTPKRILVLGIGVTATIALLLAAVLAIGSSTQQSDREASRANAEGRGTEKSSASGGPRPSTGEEALRRDARWYARDVGVSVDEAVRRLKMQDDRLPMELERELKKDEADTFAGLWLRHKPDYGLTVATAGDPEEMARKIDPVVAGTRWEGIVDVRRVEKTEAELRAVRTEAEKLLDRLGISYGSGANVFKNRIEIDVKDKAKVERKLKAAGWRLPEHVVLKERWMTLQVGSSR